MMRTARRPQLGAAILTAMLTVVLVATLATAALWQQWRGVEVEAAERGRVQSSWVLVGALDWARLILREDGRKGGADHLAEPWAIPLAQARLSSFLAADRSDTLAAEETPDAFLSGQIVDLQSRLNVTNLIQEGKINEPSRLAFARLFELLSLPPSELKTMADNLRLALDTQGDQGVSAAARLVPQDVDQLAWVGLSPASIRQLRPFITVLPVRTPVNLNTAPAEVIYACVTGVALADAHRLVTARNTTHLASLADATKAAGNIAAQFNDTQHSVSTRFFEVRGNLQVEQTTVVEQSVVQRDGLDVKTLSRKRGVAAPAGSLQ
jgi:general secretion pathway protein K